MKNIVWLASYPKSGNTWLRVFLANLMTGESKPFQINHLSRIIPGSASRAAFDGELGIDSADLDYDECDRLREGYHRFVAGRTSATLFYKIHDAFSFLPDGTCIVPRDVTKGAVYLVRNPLDVAVSYANHAAIGLDQAIDWINREDACLFGDRRRPHTQLRQRLLSWSGHVRSWTERDWGFEVHVMRYEDMKQEPETVFTRTARFIGMDAPTGRIRKALEFSDFKELKSQEERKGFAEKPMHCRSFFNQGKTGTWRTVLSAVQVRRIVERHGEMMDRFGYLEDGEPVY